MRRVALLTMDTLDDFFAYDSLLDEPMKKSGWQTSHVSWRQRNIDWNKFECVIVRSTWDYQQDVSAFLETLKAIDQSSAILENPLPLMLWNLEKTYLLDLSNKGIPIVPTVWKAQYASTMLSNAFTEFNCKELVVKPTISANADDTFRLNKVNYKQREDALKNTFASRALMIQPFLDAVLQPGEYSLFYFDNQYSHTILKTPKKNDFRVQEEHGGKLQTVHPDASMLTLAEGTLDALPARALYARIDLIQTPSGFAVMEVELIEPSLYFNMDEKSASRFVHAFCRKYG